MSSFPYPPASASASAMAATFNPPSMSTSAPVDASSHRPAPSSTTSLDSTRSSTISIPWRADDTALNVFHRATFAAIPRISIRLTGSRLELVQFHDQYEVIASISEVPEFVLSASMEISQQLQDDSTGLTHILHISTGDTWHTSMEQSGIDLSGTTLFNWHEEGRVKTSTVTHLQQLYHISEYLQTKMKPLERLVIFIEGSTPLILAEKPIALGSVESKLPPLVEQTLMSFATLVRLFPVMCFWINSQSPALHTNATDSSSNASSIWREAHPKDAIASLWRKKISKVLVYAPQQM